MRWLAAFTRPGVAPILLKDGEDAKRRLEEAISKFKPWKSCIRLIRSCLECEDADRDAFARKVNDRLSELFTGEEPRVA